MIKSSDTAASSSARLMSRSGSMEAFGDLDKNNTIVCKNPPPILIYEELTLDEDGNGGDNENGDAHRRFIDLYLVGGLCIVGFFGNAVTMAVLRRDPGRVNNTTNWLLQNLALVDTLYLLTCVFIQPLKAIKQYHPDWLPGLSSVYPYMELYIWPLASIAQTLTVWTVLLVTVDRYVAVCMPLCRSLRTIRRAKIMTSVALLLSVLYNIPLFFEREVQQYQLCQNDNVKTVKSRLRKNYTYFLVYKTFCYFLFRTAGPLAALIVLNARLIATLKQRHRRMARRRSQHSRNVTSMLVAVVSLFILCEIPDLILRLIVSVSVIRTMQQQNNMSLSSLSFSFSAPALPPHFPTSVVFPFVSTTPAFVSIAQSSSYSTSTPSSSFYPSLGFTASGLDSSARQLGDSGVNVTGGGGYRYYRSVAQEVRSSYSYGNSVVNMLLAVNSSINFLVYCLVGNKFRRIFIREMACQRNRGVPAAGRAAPGTPAGTRGAGGSDDCRCRFRAGSLFGGGNPFESSSPSATPQSGGVQITDRSSVYASGDDSGRGEEARRRGEKGSERSHRGSNRSRVKQTGFTEKTTTTTERRRSSALFVPAAKTMRVTAVVSFDKVTTVADVIGLTVGSRALAVPADGLSDDSSGSVTVRDNVEWCLSESKRVSRLRRATDLTPTSNDMTSSEVSASNDVELATVVIDQNVLGQSNFHRLIASNGSYQPASHEFSTEQNSQIGSFDEQRPVQEDLRSSKVYPDRVIGCAAREDVPPAAAASQQSAGFVSKNGAFVRIAPSDVITENHVTSVSQVTSVPPGLIRVDEETYRYTVS